MKWVISSTLAASLFCLPMRAQSNLSAESATIEGIIAVSKGRPSLLRSQGKDIRLSSEDESVAKTLQDSRISGKQLKLVGKFRDDGSFDVADLFAVHPDGLYRIIYYCQVCHITAFKPGNCVCCQQPTELQEVPLSDPRVYQEKVESPSH